MQSELIREFHTPHFTVRIDALPDDDLDLSWDDDGSVREGLESGRYIAFMARARVFLDGAEIACDYLGGCIYESLQDFCQPRGYFIDMVRNVCHQARESVRRMQSVRVREIRA